ncbi:polysaccharide deacetylase family protein [Nocardia sp. NPDC050799]|uniref:polysaccharide deacetylase family protein n=1 Tax=Nocardia sp. NPDC050799 TaxID=3154842 RepID=UPI0033CC295C
MVRFPGAVVRAVVAAMVCAAAAACGGTPAAQPPQTTPAVPPPPAVTTPPPPDPAAVGADELGMVPILMYHQLSPRPGGEYDQTPAEFRAELDRLYREGYRPITAAQYAAGAVDIPAGTHPVVLTFDDSTTSQLRFTPDGVPAPDCAVAVLEEFAARHPDFPARATFYVTDDPFGGDPRALPWLARHGYEIGAHTATHPDLGSLDAAGVQRELAQNVRTIGAAAPGTEVRTMALPLGSAPADPALALAGSWDGTGYRFEAAMLVGANPAPSPFGAVDPAAVPRIRSGLGRVPFDSAYWLDELAANPESRFTSDGDPRRISFPRAAAGDLAPRWAERAAPY